MRLLEAVFSAQAPAALREGKQVQILRRMWVQRARPGGPVRVLRGAVYGRSYGCARLRTGV
ncbi:hypothetical protein, partial [Streptomyces sp. NPDC058621]|uniref:hypothetical protein n=1 Tax=Streptomyces sp. NPDC058621 TaxID=3346561 RepID=UPI00364ADA45